MSPETIAALAELERDNGRLLPDDVVEAARAADHPLHQFFDWNDSQAAEKYRRMQAAQLIRRVRVTVEFHDVPITTPKYLRDPSAETGEPRGYREIGKIRSEEDNARAVIVEEMRRISQAVRRAKTLAAALGLVDDIERIDELAQSLVARARTVGDQPEGTA
jgi:hypothetical protein